MANDNRRLLDIITVLNILLTNSTDQVKLVLHAAIAEIKALRRIRAAAIEATQATSTDEKKATLKALLGELLE